MTSIPETKELERPAEENPPPTSAVREALRQILESQPFRTSKQCQDLLRYIVDRSLSGDDASLRERVIGTEVFARKPTYDTGEDPVVRVRAADVRKRLAQYYQSLEPGNSAPHIELLAGSYRASFRHDRPIMAHHAPAIVPQAQPEIPVQTYKRTHSEIRHEAPDEAGTHPIRFWQRKSFLVVLIIIVVAIAGVTRVMQSSWTSPQERFWTPLLSTKQPVLLYLGSNVAYIFTTDYLAKYRAQHGVTTNGPEFFVNLQPGSSVQASDLQPVPDTFVTVGDLAASAQLVTLMADWKRAFVLRSGRDISFGDLRNRPSVMIGGFNNPWTLELTKNLPYSLRQGTRIQDRDHPQRAWVMMSPNSEGGTDDYALISRLPVSETGGPLITVAGIGQYGTQAAAEFVSSPDRMRDLLKSAPAGWQNKNMQAVLHIKVVGYAPVAVDVVATAYW